MKNIKKLVFLLLSIAFVSSFVSCEDEYSLGRKLDPSELDFSVIQDYAVDPGGNTVVLTNNTPQTSAIWDYGTGKSYRNQDVIHFAFAGEYTIYFSALTDGGIVDADPVTITVTADNFDYVTNPLWVKISGGVGNSKTWLLDLDENGLSRYFAGPMYYYGTDNGWLEGGDAGCYGTDCWNWSPDWASNTWIMSAANYGTMTFSLDGGPFLDVDHLTLPTYGQQSGTYYLDTSNYTLSTSDATILHNSGFETCVPNWNSMKIMSLTEDYMQLAITRGDHMGSCSGDGPCLLVYNFISQEYFDNWTPPDPEEPQVDEGFQPTFAPDELLDMLTGGPGTGRVWKLDGFGNPVDWLASGIGWTTSSSSSYSWGWNDEWADISNEAWIQFDQFGGNQNYLRYQGGTLTTGTFTIQEGAGGEDYTIVTLNDGETLIQNPNSWMNPTTSEITVVKAFNDSYMSNGIWFGTSYNPNNDEWLVYHYIVNTTYGGGGSGGGGNTGTSIAIDNAKIAFGDLEGNGKFRIEMYNDFGSTSADPPLNTSELVFSNSIEVTFTLSGVTFIPGAAGSYQAALQYADADWSFQYWGDGNGIGDTTVTGDGTYTVSINAGTDVAGAVVFVIDILGMAAEIADLPAVTATIDEIIIN